LFLIPVEATFSQRDINCLLDALVTISIAWHSADLRVKMLELIYSMVRRY
jgi:hypothetical protein